MGLPRLDKSSLAMTDLIRIYISNLRFKDEENILKVFECILFLYPGL